VGGEEKKMEAQVETRAPGANTEGRGTKTKTMKVKDLNPRRKRQSGDRVRLADGRWAELKQSYPTKGGLRFKKGHGYFLQWADDNNMWSAGFFCSEDEVEVRPAT
jgi:hypothetical protein